MNKTDMMIHKDGVYAYRPGDVAAITGVKRFTLIAWSNEGWVECRRSSGGHRRYCNRSIQQVEALMEMRGTRKRS